MISQYFTGGMMPEAANPTQPGATIMEIRPFRGGDGLLQDGKVEQEDTDH